MAEILDQRLLQPLEDLFTLSIPKALDGSKGSNRALIKPAIKAQTDLEAIRLWLAEYSDKPSTTYSHYRKDAERLLLWAIVARKKPLSGLESDDLLSYSQFLDDPQPRGKWCSGKGQRCKRWEENWKPFEGPLSPAAKVTAFANLTSLFNYLVEMNYLAHNPFKGVRRQIKQNSVLSDHQWQVQERILGLDEWYAIQDALEKMSEITPEECREKARLKFILALFYFAGLRIFELTSHTMNAFKKVFDHRKQKDRWWLVIKGKGDKQRKIPINRSLLDALREYRRTLNMSDLPKAGEGEPLVCSFRTRGPITARRINQLLKTLCGKAAKDFEMKEPEKAVRLKKVSAHWLRHLSFSMQDLADIRKQHIKENAGHGSERTTEIYIHAVDDQRHEEMEKLAWRLSISVD